jgi:hypothetical protein
VDLDIGGTGFGGPIAPALRVDDETAPLLGFNDVFLSWRSCGLGLDASWSSVMDSVSESVPPCLCV